MLTLLTIAMGVYLWVVFLRLIWPGADADVTFWTLFRFILALIWMLPVWFLAGVVITFFSGVGA